MTKNLTDDAEHIFSFPVSLMAGDMADIKLTLPAFLKVLTNGKMTMAKAMGVAGKM